MQCGLTTVEIKKSKRVDPFWKTKTYFYYAKAISMTILVMAAGSGSRYGKPKQFDNLGPKGEFLMEYSIYDAIRYGFSQVIIITQQDMVAAIQNYFSLRLPVTVDLQVLAQNTTDLPQGNALRGTRGKPWGTAHAGGAARHLIKNSFAVINADDFYGKSAFMQAASFLKNKASLATYGMVSYFLKETLSINGTVSRGICSITEEHLTGIQERTKIGLQNGILRDQESQEVYTGEEQVSMNFWLCSPSFFTVVTEQLLAFMASKANWETAELYIPIIIQQLIKNKSVEVLVMPTQSQWFGVTYAADRPHAVATLKRMTTARAYPTPLWKLRSPN